MASSQGMGERAIKLDELRQVLNCLAIAQEIRDRCEVEEKMWEETKKPGVHCTKEGT